MKTVQMTLDDDLVKTVDRVVKQLRTTRSAFTRDALRRALRDLQSRKLEEKHREGYARRPVAKDEFAAWEREQNWGDR
jgi:metal-responsive CopG/Arc/MetJ family transcriptional regulator